MDKCFLSKQNGTAIDKNIERKMQLRNNKGSSFSVIFLNMNHKIFEETLNKILISKLNSAIQ